MLHKAPHNRLAKKRSGFASDLPHKKWTTFSINLPVAQIQAENNTLTPSVVVFYYKNA
jgi:hypothetical protein